MKKLIIFLSIGCFLIVSSYYAYSYYQKKSELKDLVPVTINGISYQTTGVLPAEDINGNLAIKELITLGNKGRVDTKEFHIIHGKGSNFTIEILKPYDKNRQIFIQWLKDNGYSHVNPDQFTYLNLP